MPKPVKISAISSASDKPLSEKYLANSFFFARTSLVDRVSFGFSKSERIFVINCHSSFLIIEFSFEIFSIKSFKLKEIFSEDAFIAESGVLIS